MKVIIAFLFATIICSVSAADCGAMPNNSVLAGTECYEYFYCSNGSIQNMKCNKYYKFNANSGKCEYSPDCAQGEVTPGSENPCAAATAKDGDFKASNISCKYFYFCHKGLSILQTCADGWGFVEKDQMCVRDHKCIA